MWGSIAGIAGSIIGGQAQSKAADKAAAAQIEAAKIAADAQIEAVEKGIDYQQMYYEQSRNQQLPWSQAGIAALTKIAGTIEYAGDRPDRSDYTTKNDEGAFRDAYTEWQAKADARAASRGRMVRPPDPGPAPTMEQFQGGEFDQQGYEQAMSDYRGTATLSGGLISEMPDIAPAMEYKDYDFKSDPGYKAGLTEGVNVLEHAAAAKGQLFSGEQQKALMQFGQDYASQKARQGYENYLSDYERAANLERGQYFDKLGAHQSLAQTGQTSANIIGQGAMQTGAQGAQNILAGGQAIASGALRSGEATAQNILAQGRVKSDLYSGIGGAISEATGYYQGQQTPGKRPAPPIRRTI